MELGGIRGRCGLRPLRVAADRCGIHVRRSLLESQSDEFLSVSFQVGEVVPAALDGRPSVGSRLSSRRAPTTIHRDRRRRLAQNAKEVGRWVANSKVKP